MTKQHYVKNKIIINGELQVSKNIEDMADDLIKMNVVKGDLIRFEPFTENDGDYSEPFHGTEFTVEKVVKVLKKTWNSSHFNAIEIYLTNK